MWKYDGRSYEEMKKMLSDERDRVIPTHSQMKQALMEQESRFAFQFTKNEVLNKDYSSFSKMINNLALNGKIARETLVLSIGGYDDTSDELHEIKEVREFMKGLIKKFPFLLYYLTNEFNASIWVVLTLADEVVSVSNVERMTPDEINEKYGSGFDNIPIMHSQVLFYDNGKSLLKPLINHAKMKKDVKNGKRMAVQYALMLIHPNKTLEALNISDNDLRELGFEV
ncbi:hypothetical protein [Bacillus pumilus]|uniref:hypothetical protein n=1 Tax=Bacillus pumilus TaxID=1408 RepID=UPI0011A4EF75|nr:hypothetical protein [Bacillus pumilus]